MSWWERREAAVDGPGALASVCVVFYYLLIGTTCYNDFALAFMQVLACLLFTALSFLHCKLPVLLHLISLQTQKLHVLLI